MGLVASAAALATAPAPLLAQNTAEPSSPVAIGPAPLSDFNLKGTVTRRAEPEATPPARPVTQQAPPAAQRAEPRQQAPATAQSAPVQPQALADRPRPAPAQAVIPAPAASLSFELPPVGPADGVPVTQPVATPGFAPLPSSNPSPAPAAGVALGEGPPIPWILAALLLALGGGYYFWRQRSRPAYAGADLDLVSPRAAAPTPQPRPAPTPPAPAPAPEPLQRTSPPAGGGIVSTRLRPWIDISFAPLRFILTDDAASLEFEVSVQNSGGAVARDVRVEAAMFTASPTQDQEIEAFFAHPQNVGDPIETVAPLKRMTFTNSVALRRDQLKLFQVDGKLMFVPVIGFTALYRSSGGDAQTSVSHIVGRDTGGEKLGPLRADLGPRVFRTLGARQHNIGVRK